MRIALDLLYLLPGVVGGTETYAAGLLDAFSQLAPEDEFLVFLNREGESWPLPQAPNFRRVVCAVRARSRGQRYFYQQTWLPRLLRAERVDLVHALAYVGPLRAPCPLVVTVPDLNFRTFGVEMPAFRRLALSFFVRRSVDRAAHVIAISHFTKDQIMRELQVPSARISVAHLAAPQWASLPSLENETAGAAPLDPYIVAFSSPSPNKNIPVLINAFMRAKTEHRIPHSLVIVGHRPSGHHFYEHLHDAIRFTGYLEAGTLHTLLSGAQLLAFPSLYEGFGLPVLEAMAAGVPVVCSDRAALPEVAGDAAIYFDPTSEQDVTNKLVRVSLNERLRKEMQSRGFSNVKRFSWTATGSTTLDIYRRIVTDGFVGA